jgi:hypothetical protein
MDCYHRFQTLGLGDDPVYYEYTSRWQSRASSYLSWLVPLYQKEQWETLRAIDTAIDKTWEQWNAEGEEFIAELEARRIQYVQIPVDLDELNQYCKEQGIPNDPTARCKFVRFKESQRKKDVYCAKVSKN